VAGVAGYFRKLKKYKLSSFGFNHFDLLLFIYSSYSRIRNVKSPLVSPDIDASRFQVILRIMPCLDE
jgi:hypothetical protein